MDHDVTTPYLFGLSTHKVISVNLALNMTRPSLVRRVRQPRPQSRVTVLQPNRDLPPSYSQYDAIYSASLLTNNIDPYSCTLIPHEVMLAWHRPVGQTTRTQEYLHDRPHAPTKRVHCCILFNELARPLEDYENSEALVTIVYHALLGKANILVMW